MVCPLPRRWPPKAQKSFSCPPVITRELGQDYADRARRILADIQEAGEAMASHIATP